MTPQSKPKSDTKLLLAVAGVVVAGAIGVALVAGLTVESDRAATSAVERKQAKSVSPRTTARREPFQPKIELASLESAPAVSEIAPAIEPVPPAFEIDPEADPWREGNRAYHESDYGHAAAYFRADADARPDRAYTRYMLGLALWKSGELDEALQAMERSVEINDASIRTFVNLSRIQNARGEFEGARSAAERALALDGESATALYLLARSQYNLGRIDEAIATLEACIGFDQAAAEAHNLLGLVGLQKGEGPAALAAFETAAALKPDVAYIQNNLGLALEKSGRLEDAAIALRRAVEIDATHQAATVSLARIEQRLPVGVGGESSAVELAEAGQGAPGEGDLESGGESSD